MQIKILRARGSHADGVDPWILETEQIVEHDRVQRGAKLKQTLGRAVQMPTFICGADDEHAHVLCTGCIERRVVVLTDEIPVQIHIVEGTAVAAGCDQIRRTMG